MENLLFPFVKPDEWASVHPYGKEVEKPLLKSYALLEATPNGSGELYATVTGILAARLPGSGVNPNLELSKHAVSAKMPKTVNLYLHAWPTGGDIASFTLDGRRRISAFAYLNVDSSTLESSLNTLLDAAVLGGALTRKDIVQRLVLGGLAVRINKGDLIGKAERLGFAVLAEDGPIDPAYAYSQLNGYTPETDALVSLLGENWPLVDALDETKFHLFHMTTLNDLRTDCQMTYEQWRQVGDNQKSLWRQLLLKRVGQAPIVSAVPAFDFDLLDWRNIFQIEAVTEFYANFIDPWKTGATLPSPPLCTTVNLLNPFGKQARMSPCGNPKRIRFDDPIDLESIRVKEGYDILYLDGALKQERHLISSVMGSHTVELNTEPMLSGTHSTWRISLSPVLVLIDPFGPRICGTSAEVTDNAAGNEVKLIDSTRDELKRVNRYFDTVYFTADDNRHSYRIVDRDADKQTIQLDETPILGGPGQKSKWFIQSGVSTQMPALYYDLGSGNSNYKNYPSSAGRYGYDHFDGLLFLVHNSRVQAMYRWSSFSSRIVERPISSSIRGNCRYEYRSLTAGNPRINYSFILVDKGETDPNCTKVRSARYYFEKVVRDDSVADSTPCHSIPNSGGGKSGIFIHWSRSIKGQPTMGDSRPRHQRVNKNSAGCIVSPLFEQLRAQLIRIHQEDHVDCNEVLNKIANLLVHKNSEKKYSNVAWHSKWNDELHGSLWLIRPDERPEGT